MSNWFQLQATEERINYLAFFYKFVTEFVKHFDKWNLNSDWKNFKNIKIFPTLNSHNMADAFREELMIAMFLLRNTLP